jgi:hypothetical protein
LLSYLLQDSPVAEKKHTALLRFSVCTIIGPIQVHVASELIIAACAAAAAMMQAKVGSGIETLENSFGGGEIAGEMSPIVWAKRSDWKEDVGSYCKWCVQ